MPANCPISTRVHLLTYQQLRQQVQRRRYYLSRNHDTETAGQIGDEGPSAPARCYLRELLAELYLRIYGETFAKYLHCYTNELRGQDDNGTLVSQFSEGA